MTELLMDTEDTRPDLGAAHTPAGDRAIAAHERRLMHNLYDSGRPPEVGSEVGTIRAPAWAHVYSDLLAACVYVCTTCIGLISTARSFAA